MNGLYLQCKRVREIEKKDGKGMYFVSLTKIIRDEQL